MALTLPVMPGGCELTGLGLMQADYSSKGLDFRDPAKKGSPVLVKEV